MKYTLIEVLNKIENAHRFGKDPGVVVTGKMLDQLGHPEKNLPYIHVAGTNGKGSTCTFLESMAIADGKKVGKFTSPHLISFGERITVNREMISDRDIERLGNFLLEQDFRTEPTMFDYCLVMALLYFKEQKCDLVILETGLGGRLDSTSALCQPPMLCVITRIGFDHMAILGNTLSQIASEKAGIIKKGIPVVCGPQEDEALAEIKKQMQKVNNSLSQLHVIDGSRIKDLEKAPLKMIGAYQHENAAIALLAMELLFAETKTDFKSALSDAVWPGRMEVISENPFLLVDGAHNSNGVAALAKSLKQLYPDEKFHFVMGVMADKDYLEMIRTLLPLATDFRTVTPESDRALQGEELAKMIAGEGVEASFEHDWVHFLKDYLSKNNSGEKLVCFGSLYFIGDVRAHFAML